eukprot:14352065-Heterocapsa_arctica.AAC.1
MSNTSARDYLPGGCESHAAKRCHALVGGRCAHLVCARECSLKASLTPSVALLSTIATSSRAGALRTPCR